MHRILAAGIVGLLSACASAPKGEPGRLITADAGLERTRSAGPSRREQSVERAAVDAARSLRVEAPVFAPGAAAALTPREQDALLAGVARTLCKRAAEYFEVVPGGRPADLVLRGEITGVGTSSRAGAAASLVAGVLSPVPFTPRVPAGLGGLSADVVAQRADGATVLALRWGQGANAFTTDATPSRIGDAYELADHLARDVRNLLRGKGEARPRKRLDRARRTAGVQACEQAFGRIDTGTRIARFALPLTPEFVEPAAREPASKD